MPIARQNLSTVVSEVWHRRATAVIELSETPAGSSSTACATRCSAGRRFGIARCTRSNTDGARPAALLPPVKRGSTGSWSVTVTWRPLVQVFVSTRAYGLHWPRVATSPIGGQTKIIGDQEAAKAAPEPVKNASRASRSAVGGDELGLAGRPVRRLSLEDPRQSTATESFDHTMLDLIYVLATVGFFVLTALLARGLERIHG